MRVWLGPELYVIIHDAVSAEIVTRSRYCLDKPSVYNIVREGLNGDGLFTMPSGYLDYFRLQTEGAGTQCFECFYVALICRFCMPKHQPFIDMFVIHIDFRNVCLQLKSGVSIGA